MIFFAWRGEWHYLYSVVPGAKKWNRRYGVPSNTIGIEYFDKFHKFEAASKGTDVPYFIDDYGSAYAVVCPD